jgi:hypothetical protein
MADLEDPAEEEGLVVLEEEEDRVPSEVSMEEEEDLESSVVNKEEEGSRVSMCVHVCNSSNER